jgi:perosamine synthetase
VIPLVSPTITDIDRRHLAARAYDDGAYAERTVREFEAAFAARVGCAGAVAVCSGTTALELTFPMTFGRFSVPTYACSAVLNAASTRDTHHDPYLVDGTFDVATATMTQMDKATLVVHAFGTSTKGQSAPLEDWTLSLGGVGALLGTLGVCSLHRSKMISTGRGGVVFSNDEALLQEVRERAYYDDSPNGRLGAQSLGMSPMQACLGLSQLRQLDDFIYRRREIAGHYTYAFQPAGIECPDIGTGSVFFRYLIAVDGPAAKVAALAEHGIEAGRGVYPPLHRQLGMSDDQFPGATWCVNHLLSVPCHPSLSDADVAFVASKVVEVCA